MKSSGRPVLLDSTAITTVKAAEAVRSTRTVLAENLPPANLVDQELIRTEELGSAHLARLEHTTAVQEVAVDAAQQTVILAQEQKAALSVQKGPVLRAELKLVR